MQKNLINAAHNFFLALNSLIENIAWRMRPTSQPRTARPARPCRELNSASTSRYPSPAPRAARERPIFFSAHGVSAHGRPLLLSAAAAWSSVAPPPFQPAGFLLPTALPTLLLRRAHPSRRTMFTGQYCCIGGRELLSGLLLQLLCGAAAARCAAAAAVGVGCGHFPSPARQRAGRRRLCGRGGEWIG